MPRTVLDSPMGQMIYSDALLRMAGGAQLLPHEQDVLTLAPLPESFISPFASRESGLLETLRTTAKALDVWDEEIKKVDYFTKHFTDLSKMVMKGVTTMGRGLMSLHNMGEDLSLSPKSIQDLIMIASYHFRKSYIGVLQTVKKYPEVSTRLLVNQLDWANMIFRLNVTKAKLAKPSVVGCQLPVASEAASSQLPAASGGAVSSCQLPAASDVISGQLPTADESIVSDCLSPLDGEVVSGRKAADRELSELKPISGPGAIGASRAFSPLFGKAAASSQRPEIVEAASSQQSAASEMVEENMEFVDDEDNKESNENGKSEIKKSDPAEAKVKKDDSYQIKDIDEKQNGSADVNEINIPENEISGEEGETDGVRPSCLNAETRGSDPTVPLDPVEQAFTQEKKINPDPDPPGYMDIIKKAYERNKEHPDRFAFTYEEVLHLAADPEFNRDNPEFASQFREALMRAGP